MKEKDSEFYNEVYRSGGWNGFYFKEAEEIAPYFPTWLYVYQHIKLNGIDSVLDLGCGVGHFASLFSDKDNIFYNGIDFSNEAIEQAEERNESNPNCSFEVLDLRLVNFDLVKFVTAFEFFEHISFDLDIVTRLEKDTEIFFSVPNYDSAGHVRFFKDYESIVERYGEILELELIHELKTNKKNVIFLCRGIRK